MKQKVLLAFSGGLDTTFCAVYLAKEFNYEIHTVTVDTGGFSATELAEIENKAKSLGVASHKTIDASENFYNDCVRFLIAGNVLRNHNYPLCVSAERAFQALGVAKYAKEIGAQAIAHGSTGAGNDQVRFDLNFLVYCPEMKIITPIRDLKLSRQAEIEYLEKAGIKGNWTKHAYSINKGLWGTSVGGVETLNSYDYLPETAFPDQVTKNEPEIITLGFHKGHIVKVNNEEFTTPVAAIQKIESLASQFAIGRDIHVGDTIIGIKGRVGFAAAAPTVILKAHQTLEKHVLTKHQMQIKDQLSATYGSMVHEALFLEPVLRNIEQFFESTQQRVTGEVRVLLSPYRMQVLGIKSEFDLMSAKFGTYGEMNNTWSGEDVKGFTKILANSQAIYYSINNGE